LDFELNEDQRILQKSARDFLKKECPKDLVRNLADVDPGHSTELWQKMAALGWMGLLVPGEYDGIGWSFVEQAVLLEEMGFTLCPAPLFQQQFSELKLWSWRAMKSRNGTFCQT